VKNFAVIYVVDITEARGSPQRACKRRGFRRSVCALAHALRSMRALALRHSCALAAALRAAALTQRAFGCVRHFSCVALRASNARQVPDFNTMYELFDPCTLMFFFRNKARRRSGAAAFTRASASQCAQAAHASARRTHALPRCRVRWSSTS
jgi:hypothetical protein